MIGTHFKTSDMSSRVFAAVLLTVGIMPFPSALASNEVCTQWSRVEHVTHFPVKDFPEISGMIASPNIPGRFYLVNDSGYGPYFYSYDLPAGKYEKVEIKGFKGWDIEAISFGPCGGERQCIFIADIGDNLKQRKIIRIAGVVEKERFGKSVSPLFHKILNYPDNKGRDSEGIVVSKNGYLYLFSKEFDYISSNPTEFFRVSIKTLLSPGQSSLEKMGEIILEGTFKSPLLTVTDAALSPDENRLFLLGYVRSYEIHFPDLLEQAERSDKIVLNYRSIGTGMGLQNEAATYTPDGESILWTYESKTSDPPLLKKSCYERPDSA